MSLHDRADAVLREQAIEILADKLREGKKVGRCDFTGLLDCELNDQHQYLVVLSEISALLQTTGREERNHLADMIRDGIIERYLTHPDQEELVSEEIAEIEGETPERDPLDYLQETEVAA
jgi:hypothetical protein